MCRSQQKRIGFCALPLGSGVIFAPQHMSIPQPPDPVCKAILLCQKTIVEAGTGSVSIIGTFDGFVVDDRLTTGPAEAFCQITEAQGLYSFTIEIQDLSAGTVVAAAQGVTIEVPDRLMRANVIFPIPPMTLPHVGVYDIVILANGSEIDRQQFRIVQRQG